MDTSKKKSVSKIKRGFLMQNKTSTRPARWIQSLDQLAQRGYANADHASRQAHTAAGRFFRKKGLGKRIIISGGTLGISFFLIFVGSVLLWIATLRAPTFTDFTERKIATSTRIYDATGKVLLYDVHDHIERTIVTFDKIDPDALHAIIAIEDKDFYQHPGIKIGSTIRAITNTVLTKIGLRRGSQQGGSTITQQVIKNTLLTQERSVSRKVKEWFLALKLEKVLSKDQILTHYLNEAPYGGSVYGIETASENFFGVHADNLTVAQAAYLAAIPNAPTLYSPYGNNVEKLKQRKNLVLLKMKEQGYITDAEYIEARAEEVVFRPENEQHAKAIHFVEYVRTYLEEKYGKDVVENEGLQVITTLDWDIQQAAELAVQEEALKNEAAWNASNMALVALDPTTGGILAMVGSRGYLDDKIDGKFNVALAERQPGSSFKPIVYALGFSRGYTDKTILFDVPTQFAGRCPASSTAGSERGCYAPKNYDGLFRGPLMIRNALAESRNIPAVKMLYLVGVREAVSFARKLGITTLRSDADQYGLTLVLGGGEVRLLDMVSAYSVFANDGIRHAHMPILSVTDRWGKVLESYDPTLAEGERVIDEESVRILNDILSDNNARAPLFGTNSFMNFGGRYDVAAKTGTTNNNRDAWIIGYSPSIAIGVWSGNNDNTPMKKGSSISGPAWRRVMDVALAKLPNKRFPAPQGIAEDDDTIKPILRGIWQGGESVIIDTVSGKLATDLTPKETRKELFSGTPHSILHWVNRADPRGPVPTNPASDPQYDHWEYGVREWVLSQGNTTTEGGEGGDIPTEYDDVHISDALPTIEIRNPNPASSIGATSSVRVEIDVDGYEDYDIKNVEFFLNDILIGSSDNRPYDFTFTPSETDAYNAPGTYRLKVVAIDEIYNRGQEEIQLNIN